MHGMISGVVLPPPDCDINICRIDFNPVTDSSYSFSRHKRRTRSQKRVENNLSARRAIENRIGNHGDRLYGRVQRKQVAFLALLRHGLYAGI
jgi:hypothetical protein